jgi:hypothetical protein
MVTALEADFSGGSLLQEIEQLGAKQAQGTLDENHSRLTFCMFIFSVCLSVTSFIVSAGSEYSAE